MSGTALSRHWPLIVVLLVALLAGMGALVLPAGSAWRTASRAAFFALPIAVATAQYAYIRFERFRLWILRAWFSVTNPGSDWSLRAEFEVVDSEVAWRQASSKLGDLLTDGDSTLVPGQGNAAWHRRGHTIHMKSDVRFDPIEEEQRPILVVELPTTRRPFREWRRTIEEDVVPMLSAVERAIAPRSRKFEVTVRFPGANPYFGLFVSQIGRDAVVQFDIQLVRRVADQTEAVNVHKDRVELVASDVLAAQRLSLHYLALSAIPDRAA